MDVVPDGAAEARRVDVGARAHGVVRHVVGGAELFVDQVADVVVEPVDQREGVVVPRVVLDAERGDHGRLAAPRKVLHTATQSSVQVTTVRKEKRAAATARRTW